MGHTVQYLKALVHQEFDLPINMVRQLSFASDATVYTNGQAHIQSQTCQQTLLSPMSTLGAQLT